MLDFDAPAAWLLAALMGLRSWEKFRYQFSLDSRDAYSKRVILMTGYLFRVAIRLTQVAPICSMRGGGRISSKLDGIRSELRHTGGLPSVLGTVAMARWFSLSALWGQSVLAGARCTAGMRGLWLSNFGDGGNDFSGHADPAADLVSGHVVVDYSEEWCQRLRSTKASAGAEEI